MTTSIKHSLTILFKTAIKAVFSVEVDPMIQAAGRPEFGDYQANFALKLAKQLQLKPVDIAKSVIEQLGSESHFQKLEVSGPGFINITLTDAYLAQHLQLISQDSRLGVDLEAQPETVVVDYGGANVAKEMHVGHLRSSIIGDAIVRLLSFSGHHVIRQNHLGDWGTQFGMLIQYIIDTDWKVNQLKSYSELNTLYKQAKQRFDENPEFAEKARNRVVALQGGDAETLAIWKKLVDESKHHFQEVYTKLGVLLTETDSAGESIYNSMLPTLAKDLEQRGIAHVDAGALVIALDGFVDPDGKPLPYLIRKSDGGYLYATTDMAAIKYRIENLKSSRIIYVVDSRQKQHFAMLFAASEKANWTQKKMTLEHVAYGSVLGENNKPFKTRSGEAVKLNDLLDEAEKRAAEVVSQKHPDLSAEELSRIARTVGIGALKYADLRSDKIKDYVFSWEKMLSFDGNTAPYLQNAYVRICSIFRKGNVDLNALKKRSILITTPIEHTLAIKISELPDVIHSISINLNLHSLCEYLYDLASMFHRFYENCPVLNDPDEKIKESRLLFCDLTARTLKLGLNLLGIDVLEKM